MQGIRPMFRRLRESMSAIEMAMAGITTLLLAAGAAIIMIPLAFMISTSLKDPGQIRSDGNSLIPRVPQMVEVNGERSMLYEVTTESGVQQMAMIKKAPGGMANFVDPARPDQVYTLPLAEQTALYQLEIHWSNYREALDSMPFFQYLLNTLLVTFLGMAGMLFSSSLVAYGFSRFRARCDSFRCTSFSKIWAG
jgi:multiple sugar transport system permease protein